MTFHDVDTSSPIPNSPPGLSGSKSSKSSSYHSSYQSDDNTIFSDVGNFEDIGLDEESRVEGDSGELNVQSPRTFYKLDQHSNVRRISKPRRPTTPTITNRTNRELTVGKTRSAFPTLRNQIRSATLDGLGLLPVQYSTREPASPGLTTPIRNRSASPTASPYDLAPATSKTRRSSWQANRERKSARELEKECDEDDGDDIPDEFYLENIPISPRPAAERLKSSPPSLRASPERPAKAEKIRSVGNGTAPRPAEQGELRSPRTPINRGVSMGQFPTAHDVFKSRAKSWTAAHSELSSEAKALTEALEAHAEIEAEYAGRRNFSNRSMSDKPRIKSAIAELPPLRRTDIMIDPLPISKEKEAVLSRTRPSWLPPKNPAEEKRHLREYQRMMSAAMESEKKKEAENKLKPACRDDTASSLLRIWEEHVLPNWNHALSQKRTRELWWRGIAPRSRGTVWARAIGNELGLSDASYTAALRRARALEDTMKSGSQPNYDEQKKKAWLDRIAVDVLATYPELKIFQPGGPLYDSLLDVLKAYSMYRSDVGYVPGTSTIAALLLLNLPTPSASFSALSNILNRPLPLSFHTTDHGAMRRAHSLIFSTLKAKSPPLHTHLTSSSLHLDPAIYLHSFLTSLGTECLNLDNATRLWDIMVFEGDVVIIRAAVAWLVAMEGKLLNATSSDGVLDILREGELHYDEDGWVNGVRGVVKS